MRKECTRSAAESNVHWEQLEDGVCGQGQRLIQELLEYGVTDFPRRVIPT